MVIYVDQAWRLGIAIAGLILLCALAYNGILHQHAPPPESTITGVVECPDGRPIEGATVYALYHPYENPQVSLPRPVQVQTQAGGVFELKGLRFQPYYLVASHPLHCDSELQGVRVAQGGIQGARLRLLQGGSIEGIVDPSRGEVEGRVILLHTGTNRIPVRSTETDARGRFRFDGVLPQNYVVLLKNPGSRLRAVFLDAGTAERRPATVQRGHATLVNFGGN